MIRTVLGDIITSKSDNILMHEHIQCVSNDMLMSFGDKWLDTNRLENYSVDILKAIKEKNGVSIFVDGTPCDLGRNAALLKRISQKSSVHIVASTGFYYYPSMVTSGRNADTLAEILLFECENGMDGTNVKPGILKCAADGEITADTEKRLSAVAITQSKTQLPIYAHCSHNSNIAYRMMQIFESKNVNPGKTVLGHASRRLDAEYLSTLIKEGYYICIDQSFNGSEQEVAKTVYKLCEKGYENKLLFSHDRPLYNDFEVPERTGIDYPQSVHIERFAFLYEKLIPSFKALGITEKQILKFTQSNAGELLNI